ncbi:MAG: tripartite tricarboxylate transporter substrate binding protein [Xanthobacteraceae bacterium]|nr:tripartite tricarboxylate transporter substrate binding protein [Xanthobacteraceae bacterium]
MRLAGITLLLALGAAPAAALDYPTRPITLIVSHVPGGPSDVIARILGRLLAPVLRQPLVIENRPGAGGTVAAEQAAHAAADGYTLLMGSTSILATNPARQKNIGFDPQLDFAPITLLNTQANILVVNPAVPANSMAELIALAKASPGQLNFASSGFGAAAHLAGELFKAEAGVNIVHVAYKGAAPALQDVIAGHVQMMFATAASVIGLIKNDKMRALAVTTPRRTALLPNLPTVDKLGLKGFDATTWHGLVAPAGTPKEVMDSLQFATIEALKDPATQKALIDLDVDIIGSLPKEFDAYIKTEIPKWTAVMKASGAQID